MDAIELLDIMKGENITADCRQAAGHIGDICEDNDCCDCGGCCSDD